MCLSFVIILRYSLEPSGSGCSFQEMLGIVLIIVQNKILGYNSN